MIFKTGNKKKLLQATKTEIILDPWLHIKKN